MNWRFWLNKIGYNLTVDIFEMNAEYEKGEEAEE
jgi:hypothetical protein